MDNVGVAVTRTEFRRWLFEHSETEKECWLCVKRGNPLDSDVFYYLDAVEEALCFGWIDSTTATFAAIQEGCLIRTKAGNNDL